MYSEAEIGTLSRPKLRNFSQTITSRSGWEYGRFLSKTVFTTLKIAVPAPIPRPRVTIATSVAPGLRRKALSPNLRSLAKLLIRGCLHVEPRYGSRWRRFDYTAFLNL